MNAPPAELPGLGGSLAVSFLSLGLVCLLAWVALRWLARRGVGTGQRGPLRVLARCSLEPKRSVYVIEAAGRFFLVGVGDGPMALLAELDAAEVAAAGRAEASPAAATPAGFAAVLGRVLAKRPGAGEGP